MKFGILILVAFVGCTAALVNDNCVCSQWTCTTNQCEAPAQKPAPICKPKGRGKVNDNTYEEDDGQFVYSIQLEPKRNWDDSVQACKEAGFTHLATLDTETKRVWFHGMYTRSGLKGSSTYDKQLWTAYNNKAGSGYKWAPSGSTGWQTNWWEVGQPDGDGVCACITANTRYNDGPCTSALGRLCVAPLCADSASGSGGSGSNVRCKTSRGGSLSAQGINEASDGRYVYSIQDDTTNRGDAFAKCQNEGFAGLASLQDDAQFQFINQMLVSTGKKAGGAQYWLASNAIGRPAKDHIWPDTGSKYFGGSGSGSWWFPGEPGGDGNCTSIMSHVGQLNDLDCTVHQMPRICMAPDCAATGGGGSAPKVCSVKGRGKIDDNTYEEDDGEYIYQIQMSPKLGWAAGLQACQASGFTHLATLDTQAKNDLFVGMLTRSGHKGTSTTWYDPQLWTSYNNRGRTGYKWEATGSTAWNSSWWGPNQPDGDGVCGTIGIYGTYNDAPCEFATGRVCQKPCN